MFEEEPNIHAEDPLERRLERIRAGLQGGGALVGAVVGAIGAVAFSYAVGQGDVSPLLIDGNLYAPSGAGHPIISTGMGIGMAPFTGYILGALGYRAGEMVGIVIQIPVWGTREAYRFYKGLTNKPPS